MKDSWILATIAIVSALCGTVVGWVVSELVINLCF